MTGWRQAVFVRHCRIDTIQRALAKILDEEWWSPATPRRLRIGPADASSRGWTMIVPELANFFLESGDSTGLASKPARLCRLARELRCPSYEVDVRGAATTLFEADGNGALRISGSPSYLVNGAFGAAAPSTAGVASTIVDFGLLAVPDDVRDRIAALHRSDPAALADYLGALAGFPAWTRLGDQAPAAGELVYEPPRIIPLTAAARSPEPETRGAIARTTARGVPPAHDRRGTRPRSAARPRR